MKKQKLLLGLCMSLILTALLFSSVNVSSAPTSPEFVPGEVLVGFEETACAAVAEAISQLGGQITGEITAINAVVVNVQGSEDAFIQAITKIPGVTYAERNGIGQLDYTPNDTYWSSLWNMRIINADDAWDTYRVDIGVVIAIIDTGINYAHPDLSGRYMSGGYDWINDDWDPIDDHSHGSHCAGIAAATIDNSLGVVGVSQCKVWAEKIFNSAGGGSSNAYLASAILHAADSGVNIISMSVKFSYSTTVENAVNYAYGKGILLVASAGNSATNIDINPQYPACYTNVIAVAATTSSDVRWSGSNYGNKVEFSAPGASVYSTVLGTSYGYKTGTSMACPHVAGLAALIWSYKPWLTRSQLKSELINSVDDLGTPGKDMYYGYGRINCLKTIQSPETWQYSFRMSPYIDRIYVNVVSQSGGILIHGKTNTTYPHVNYPGPILGWGTGNTFYMALDWRGTTGYEMGFLVGTISTASGKLYRTVDGVTWTGPVTVNLLPTGAEVEPAATAASVAETSAVQYVEGLNPTATPQTGTTYVADWFGIPYVPSVTYPLKKVEIIGSGSGPVTIQLQTDSGGQPSGNVLREVTFNMVNTRTWQGAEFADSYIVSAGTTYWITLKPIYGSQISAGTSGTLIPHVWDYYSDGYGWSGPGTGFRWMARFYRELQPTFSYKFRLSPYSTRVYVNVVWQPGGMLIHGLSNLTYSYPTYPSTILGWGVGNNFYMPFDYRTTPGHYDLGFVVGTISSASGRLYRTQDGITYTGPTNVNLIAFSEATNLNDPIMSVVP